LTILDDPGLILNAKHCTIPIPMTGMGSLWCFAFKKQASDHLKWSRIGGDMEKTMLEALRWSLAKYIHIWT
jgi:hypothetical protein